MPEIVFAVKDVSEVLEAGIKARGLPEGVPPAAVVYITAVLGQAAEGFATLIGDLPADQRGFEWMEVIFAAYAEFCARAIVVDATEQENP